MNRGRRDRRGRKRERKENGEERWLSRPCVPKRACAGERGSFCVFRDCREGGWDPPTSSQSKCNLIPFSRKHYKSGGGGGGGFWRWAWEGGREGWLFGLLVSVSPGNEPTSLAGSEEGEAATKKIWVDRLSSLLPASCSPSPTF